MKTASLAYVITDEDVVPLIRVPLLPPLLEEEASLDLAGWRMRPPTLVAVPDGPLFRVLRPRDRGVLAAAKARLRIRPQDAPDRMRVLVARAASLPQREREPLRMAALPDVLTIRQVANAIGASEDLVWDHIHKGHLISIALGSRPLVKVLKVDLITFLHIRRRTSSPSAAPLVAVGNIDRISGDLTSGATPSTASTTSLIIDTPHTGGRASRQKTPSKQTGPCEPTSPASTVAERLARRFRP
jgi:hypothetical protein